MGTENGKVDWTTEMQVNELWRWIRSRKKSSAFQLLFHYNGGIRMLISPPPLILHRQVGVAFPYYAVFTTISMMWKEGVGTDNGPL